jgi:hypothetical protein
MPMLRAALPGGHEQETPTLADWAAFGDGPAPGERAPEVTFATASGVYARMGDVLRGTKHVLLMFDGAASTAEGYDTLSKIAARVLERFGDVVVPHVVVPTAEKPAALSFTGSVIFDADGAAHKRYGARSECLYLVRPDGYVAYREQPARLAPLEKYLETLFR